MFQNRLNALALARAINDRTFRLKHAINDRTFRLKHINGMKIADAAKRRRIKGRIDLLNELIPTVDENVGQADGSRESHGGTIAGWLALGLLMEVGEIKSKNFHYIFDYGSGGRLNVLLTCWALELDVICVGIENNSRRHENGKGLLRLVKRHAIERNAKSTTQVALYEGDFLEDHRLVVTEGRRGRTALVYLNNYDNCMLSIKGDLEEALSRNLTMGSVVVCFSRLFRPYDGRWTEERFEATITADGLSWSSRRGGEDKIKILPVYKYTRTERPAQEESGPVNGRRNGRTCYTDVVKKIDLTGHRHYFNDLS